jgi:thiaminase
MAANGEVFPEMTPAQLKAAIALASGATHDEAVEASGISSRTLSRLKNEDGFRLAVRLILRETYGASVAAMVAAMQPATATLLAIATDQNAPATARVSASRAILEAGLKAYGQMELEQRVEALEAVLNVK